RPINAPLDNPANFFTWWALSRGLYRRIFANLGFSVEIVTASAFNVDIKTEVTRETVIARRAENVSAATGPPPEYRSLLRRLAERAARWQ
ncbi:MAG: hypothetical protein ACYDH4_12700, partial [Candidatus Cryosericum sp.]